MFYIPLILILPSSVYGIGQPHYECGENGRFEYCIDGIPGCVVGCHCHPGFYFDTDTKICEPNAKLVQEYRRLYMAPTRVPETVLPGNEFDWEPTPTTTNPIDTQVENIAKESDDLGDWLYNQFFKTIESQVINNTDSTKDKEPQTRRSGSQSSQVKNKLKRRAQKRSKKSKKKKSDLRRKLLRITEDDSLFQSSGSSSSESDGSSSSESEDSSSDDEVKDNKKKHDDGEHRKMIVVNKQHKMPLPSFIFLPNLDTPFFPPIGLVPPPMPMYPMAPIPPMPMMPPPPPPYPIPIMTTAACTNSTAADTTTEKTKTEEIVTGDNTDSNGGGPLSLRQGLPHAKHAPGASKHSRKKFLRELKQIRAAFPVMRSNGDSRPPNAEDRIESPYGVDEDMELQQLNSVQQNRAQTPESPRENVDFKYLAQLIHKIDNEKISNQNATIDASMPLRRFGGNNLNNYYRPPLESTTARHVDKNRHLETPDDSYYTNLGQQIASIIRKIDSTGDQKVNIEIERQRVSSQPILNAKLPNFEETPIIMENSYAPRSYWERSVRSLLNNLEPEHKYYPMKTQEDSLFNLESKVETVASSARPLSLNDLENVVVFFDKTKTELRRRTTEIPETSTKINNDNLNINLLPHPYDHIKLKQKIYDYNGFRRMIPELPLPKPNNNSDTKRFMITNDAQNNLPGILINKIQDAFKIDYNNKTSFIVNAPKKIHLKTISNYGVNGVANFDHNYRSFPQYNPKHAYSQNVTKQEFANLQLMVDKNLNLEDKKTKTRLPQVPWFGHKLANILTHPNIYHLDSTGSLREPNYYRLDNAGSLREPNYKTLQETPPKYYGSNNNRYYKVSSPRLLKPQPATYFHHESRHLDVFGK